MSEGSAKISDLLNKEDGSLSQEKIFPASEDSLFHLTSPCIKPNTPRSSQTLGRRKAPDSSSTPFTPTPIPLLEVFNTSRLNLSNNSIDSEVLSPISLPPQRFSRASTNTRSSTTSSPTFSPLPHYDMLPNSRISSSSSRLSQSVNVESPTSSPEAPRANMIGQKLSTLGLGAQPASASPSHPPPPSPNPRPQYQLRLQVNAHSQQPQPPQQQTPFVEHLRVVSDQNAQLVDASQKLVAKLMRAKDLYQRAEGTLTQLRMQRDELDQTTRFLTLQVSSLQAENRLFAQRLDHFSHISDS
eukprot:c25978_g1_i1.p1 GENE.c25978_g1_i1~~c25978_g1_i1.p1  ORF type:complete len:299 (-),score=53.11 c25978_g1_i1:147-1043(-)